MTYENYYLRFTLMGISSTICWVFGGIDLFFRALLVLMALDFITGVVVAVKTKKLSSIVGFKGIGKKILILVMVAVSNLIDIAILGNGSICRTLTVAFYSANEAISILENASNSGLPLPKKLKAVLEQITND